jgi:hypothetical protein
MAFRKGGDLNSLTQRVKSEFPYLLVIVLAVFYVFRGYFIGNTAPPWDFYGDYYTQAFSWWDLGSFFHPTTYLPYLISGYPSHLGLQVSSYYIPVGIVAEFFGYTLENASRLQGFTIMFGIVGIYVLARLQTFRRPTSVLIALTYLFSAGFFSNASHIDIVRAWAFFPWLLIALKPVEKIKSWQIILFSILWFQFFVGAYPGNIASFFYAFLAWIIINLYTKRKKIKSSILLYSITIGIGILLSMPKFLPFLITGSGPKIQNQVVVDLGIISTIFFPYGGTGQSGDVILPNDLTQRTFYIIPLAVILAFFAKKSNINTIIGITFICLGIILGIDTAIFPHWQENLPLLNISRFRTIDFKPILVLGLAFLAGVGYERISDKKDVNLILALRRFIAVIFFFGIITYFAKISNLSNSDIKFGLFWLAFSIISILMIILIRYSLVVNVITFLSIFVIGLFWANHFVNPWNENRVNTEKLYFGDISSNLIESKNEKILISRPARVGPTFPIPYPGEMIIQFWNSNELKRGFTTGGYVTIKGEKTFQEYVNTALDPEKQEIMNFLAEPSTAVFVASDNNDLNLCISKETCGFIDYKFEYLKWSAGEIVLKINDVDKPAKIILNEVNWPGWKYEACNVTGDCRKVSISQNSNDFLLNANLERDDVSIKFFYETPGMIYAWYLFYIGILSLVLIIFYASKVRINFQEYESK